MSCVIERKICENKQKEKRVKRDIRYINQYYSTKLKKMNISRTQPAIPCQTLY